MTQSKHTRQRGRHEMRTYPPLIPSHNTLQSRTQPVWRSTGARTPRLTIPGLHFFRWRFEVLPSERHP